MNLNPISYYNPIIILPIKILHPWVSVWDSHAYIFYSTAPCCMTLNYRECFLDWDYTNLEANQREPHAALKHSRDANFPRLTCIVLYFKSVLYFSYESWYRTQDSSQQRPTKLYHIRIFMSPKIVHIEYFLYVAFFFNGF
jgi:hypothetical protein